MSSQRQKLEHAIENMRKTQQQVKRTSEELKKEEEQAERERKAKPSLLK